MDLSDILQCDVPPAVEPIFISQENFYDHLVTTLQQRQAFCDLLFVLDNYEVVPTNHFLLSSLSPVLQALPKGSRSETYFYLRDTDPWSAKCIVKFFYTRELVVPRFNLESSNKVLDALEINLEGKFLESADAVHFAMSAQYKRETLNKIWTDRHATFDLKFITKDHKESYAHWGILAASSEQLCTLFQGPHSLRPKLIMLAEFDSSEVELLLQFCYKGEVQIPLIHAVNVCKLANILGVKSLFHTMSDLGFAHQRNKVFRQGTTRLTCFEQKDTSRRLNLKSLFETETLSDLQVISNNHAFKVHSAILSVSPYFLPIFQQADWRHCLIFVSHLTLEVVQAFVDLIYYGEVIYQGGVQDFIADMEGLIDFALLPITSVENFDPPVPPLVEKLDLPLPDVHIPAEVQPIEEPNLISPPKLLTYTCSVCSEVFYSRKTLKSHIIGAHPHTIKCVQCSQTFSTEADLKSHCKEANHRGTDFFCTECGKTFAQDRSLRKHMKLHNSKSELFQCDICHKTCNRKDYLEEHMRTHTGKKPYKCPTCGKRFVGKTGLNHHRKIHGPPRKESVCEICGKEYTKKALWTHMKSHNKQFSCVTCNIMFATKGTLKNHMDRVHFDLRQHTCDKCPKAFNLRGELNRHIKTVHESVTVQPKKRLQCNFCEKSFAKSSSLKNHKKIHMNAS